MVEFNSVEFEGQAPIDGYGPGFFRIGGQVIRGPFLLLPSGLQSWGGVDDIANLVAEASTMDVLFIGTGATMTPLPSALRTALESADLSVEPMASPSACRTYNVLLGEGRRVGLAALPV